MKIKLIRYSSNLDYRYILCTFYTWKETLIFKTYFYRNSHSNKNSEVQKEKLKEIVSLIRKQWKCSYIDCSAKYNWKVVGVFKEIIKIIDSVQPRSGTISHREVTSLVIENMQGNMERTKCIILWTTVKY